ITLEVLDSAGKLVRKFSSAAQAAAEESADAAGGGDDEEGGFRIRSGPTRLEKTSGMHRFTWDMRHPGPWQSAARPEGPNGPMAPPGRYQVRLTAGTWTSTQLLEIAEDPRVTKSGVTAADLREQLEYNLRVRDLVSDANRTVSRLRTARSQAQGEQLAKLNE